MVRNPPQVILRPLADTFRRYHMLNLIDVLRAKGIHLENYKIHLATGSNPPPLTAFFEGRFKEWQEYQNNKNFECDRVLSLISLEGDRWLFAGVYEILGVTKGRNPPYKYRTKIVPGVDDIIGRAIIRYKKEYRASYIWGHKYAKHLEIAEIKPDRLSVGPFPGYTDVVVSHPELIMIISQEEPTWKSSLSNVKGVYLISDTTSGKMYVGSATGEGGLWQRWESYADTGHGGNVGLKDLLNAKGIRHADSFQYSILEIADSHATIDYVQSRESYWKDVLLTQQFGHNSN